MDRGHNGIEVHRADATDVLVQHVFAGRGHNGVEVHRADATLPELNGTRSQRSHNGVEVHRADATRVSLRSFSAVSVTMELKCIEQMQPPRRQCRIDPPQSQWS